MRTASLVLPSMAAVLIVRHNRRRHLRLPRVAEAFHRDATKTRSIGAAVVFDTNELLEVFAPLRVVRYEDVDAVADFAGQANTRMVRLAAVRLGKGSG